MKIRCIYVDGIDKTGKTSVLKEMRKYLKEKEKDLYEINGIDDNKLQLQNVLLQDNTNSLILKENSVLSLFNSSIKNGVGVLSLEGSFSEFLRKERDINQKYGSVHFFLIPDDHKFLLNRLNDQSFNLNLQACCTFFKNINSYSVSQGLNIETVLFDENDKIYDIRDKILEILNRKYQI